MARFTLSIADDVAAQLDAYAAENNLNRSEAAEHLFRSAFQPQAIEESEGTDQVENADASGDLAYVADQLLEIQDYFTLVHANYQLMRNLVVSTADIAPGDPDYPRMLPEPPWVRRARGYS